MNTTNTTVAHEAAIPCYPQAAINRAQMRQAVVDVLWAQAHVLDRVVGRREAAGDDPTNKAPSAFRLLGKPRVAGTSGALPPDLDLPASTYGIEWKDVSNTALAQTMEELYDFAYLATFDPRYYPGELGDETGAWWVAMYLKDFAGSRSLSFQADYSGGGELTAAHNLLQIVETANARHILEGADETFVDDSAVGFLTIRQLALVSDFKEDSLRVLANPKRKNALPTQSVSGSTVVAVGQAREWLTSKGRYTPVSPRLAATRPLDLKTARFATTAHFCAAMSEQVSLHAARGSAAKDMLGTLQEIYPDSFWKRDSVTGQMFDAGLELSVADLQDEPRLRLLARALELDADLLLLKAKEAALREGLAAVESQIRARSS